MYKQIITITKGAETLPYSSLKKCCELNTDFSYDYIVRFKMPFDYKGWTFNRLNFNLPIGKKREGEIIETVNDAETLIKCDDKCNMHFVRLRSILSTMKCSNYETDKKLIANLDWYKSNLHIHNGSHPDYLEAINLIDMIK